jgi:hypothetical protein
MFYAISSLGNRVRHYAPREGLHFGSECVYIYWSANEANMNITNAMPSFYTVVIGSYLNTIAESIV